MKKILGLILCLMLVVSVSGCARSGKVTTAPPKNNDEVIEEEVKEEIENERVEEFTNYDQVIVCDSKDGSYMKYYYDNYKAVRFERLVKCSSVEIAESERDRLISEEGRNNVRVIGTDTFLISDSSDPMWYVYNLSQNDVYRKYENDWMEAGWICSTKDKK